MPDVSFFATLPSPLGDCVMTSLGENITGLYLPEHRLSSDVVAGKKEDVGPFRTAFSELEAYFSGEKILFSFPILLEGTAFQKKVWAALQTIPFGATWSYSALACAVGKPLGARSVGLANGKNPLSIVVPCHRVVGKKGALTGYAGGLSAKAWLLMHEQRNSALPEDGMNGGAA